MATLKNTIINDTGYLGIPSGSEAQRPNSPETGYMRFNNDSSVPEIWDGSEWKSLSLTEYPKPYVTDGLVLYLDASDTSSYSGTGTTWTDLSGNGNHFTLYNSPSHDGTKFSFDGVNDYIRSTNTINLSTTNAVTIELAFKVPTVTSNVMVFEFTPNWNTNSGAFGAYSNSNGGVASSPTTDNDIHTNSDVGPEDFNVSDITTNAIYNFVFKSGDTSLFYNNSISSNIRNGNGTFANFANDYLYIGSRGGTSAFGQMDLHYIRVYNKELSSSERTQNYNATKERFGL